MIKLACFQALADWKSDHLVQFLNMRLEATDSSEAQSRRSAFTFLSLPFEAAEDEGKTGAIGGAWSAEIQPPGSILRAGSDFQGPLARGMAPRSCSG